ncbi:MULTISPECIES: CarD family transcriptional regulator [Tepidanaerobacter]|uniref:CarD family transcriptional regulator n=1 Tax=Tepidanaerobacter TaxID=499228 RepID=UPI000AB64B40|nr:MULTISPECIES: CarD family transcriptional regulator [Tepidanaerobacter]GLI20297.1 CarD family transcriptional regulator [Tepidanaerobacter syntrophicus]GLI51616.1 CarD family transcriptional regulator [Tepidanaerobacter syntrophicus]HHV83367.1 CarD family transcriptional regulator [Tepidanaerobacter syntrophicus]
MFNIGDKVVYPMHGAGIIEAIEEKEILGEKQKYYIMKMPIGNMKVMIPLNHIEDIGIREVAREDEIQEAFNVLQGQESKMSSNWNRRYRANMDKIRSGDILQVAEVVRNLSLREKEKGLSTGERKMLENAKHILISEIVLSKNIQEDEALQMIENAFI